LFSNGVQAIETAKKTKEASIKKVAELEHTIKNAKQLREQRLKQLEQVSDWSSS